MLYLLRQQCILLEVVRVDVFVNPATFRWDILHFRGLVILNVIGPISVEILLLAANLTLCSCCGKTKAAKPDLINFRSCLTVRNIV